MIAYFRLGTIVICSDQIHLTGKDTTSSPSGPGKRQPVGASDGFLGGFRREEGTAFKINVNTRFDCDLQKGRAPISRQFGNALRWRGTQKTAERRRVEVESKECRAFEGCALWARKVLA